MRYGLVSKSKSNHGASILHHCLCIIPCFPLSKILNWWQLEIAAELDKLSAKLDDVDKMISSAMADDPQVQSLLSSTADVWMPVITATADQRREFSGSTDEDNHEEQR